MMQLYKTDASPVIERDLNILSAAEAKIDEELGGMAGEIERFRDPITKGIIPKTLFESVTKVKERVIIGELFEEDGTDWKVLDVVWSDEMEQVVVYYYDVEAANAEGILESDFMGSLLESSDHSNIEHLEYSSVKEVMGWLKSSKGAEAAVVSH